MAVEIEADYFDPFRIMDSGQCFRMVALNEHTLETVAFGQRVAITALGQNRFRFGCDPEAYTRVWRPYFALDTDYAAIWDSAPANDAFLARALAQERGLRILRQEPWETLCCFILSQRKNIKAIRACVEALCDAFGEPVEGTARKAFPTPERLAAVHPDSLGLCGLGYRVAYVVDAAQKIASCYIDLQKLAAMPDPVLFDMLTSIHGVGIKVANCAMLFGFARLSRAPVDVWIQRVIDGEYGGHSPFDAYGPYAGIYQQAMFMFVRENYEQHVKQPACECNKKTTTRHSAATGKRRAPKP